MFSKELYVEYWIFSTEWGSLLYIFACLLTLAADDTGGGYKFLCKSLYMCAVHDAFNDTTKKKR
jgi:hypothetical protein